MQQSCTSLRLRTAFLQLTPSPYFLQVHLINRTLAPHHHIPNQPLHFLPNLLISPIDPNPLLPRSTLYIPRPSLRRLYINFSPSPSILPANLTRPNSMMKQLGHHTPTPPAPRARLEKLDVVRRHAALLLLAESLEYERSGLARHGIRECAEGEVRAMQDAGLWRERVGGEEGLCR